MLEVAMRYSQFASRAGYFKQTIHSDGHQVEQSEFWDPAF